MATRKVETISSWSFSRYNEYCKCPKRAYFKFILKMKEPGSAAMDRGNAIHKMAEDYVLGKIKKLPDELKLFKEDFAAVKKQKVKFVEESWVFRSDWTETVYNDWNGAWLRVKLDLAYINVEHNVLVPIDHKTGQYKPDRQSEYVEQLELYGLASLKKFPTVDAVSPRLWYLDHGIVHPDPAKDEIVYARSDLPYLEKLWMSKIKPMMTDTVFKEKPGEACRWCHFKKENGGPCKF